MSSWASHECPWIFSDFFEPPKKSCDVINMARTSIFNFFCLFSSLNNSKTMPFSEKVINTFFSCKFSQFSEKNYSKVIGKSLKVLLDILRPKISFFKVSTTANVKRIVLKVVLNMPEYSCTSVRMLQEVYSSESINKLN